MTAERGYRGYAQAAPDPWSVRPPAADGFPGSGGPVEPAYDGRTQAETRGAATYGSYTRPEQAPSGYALDVGDSLQIWTITARVNAGVNAHVYKARDPDAVSGRDVALKVLLPQSAHGRQDQVVHEVAAMSSLTLGHPHLMSSTIARRINAGPYAGGVLIVMPWATLNLREYVLAVRRGTDLPDDGRWARPTAMCEALAGIADGLAQLHDLQTAHGDVKPDNIMLVDGVWKLGDFGLTRPMEGSYVLSAPGTLSYTAPEEARAQHADPAAEIKRRPAGDVWALGVTLHFAVTGGRFPMPGITPDERLAAVRQGDIRVSPDIAPQELRALLADQLLVDDRHRGPASYERRISAAQAGEALRRIAATEHTATRRIRVEQHVDSDAMLRYRGQCERVAAQTVELWRDLGPWDGPRAATTHRSRQVLSTMLTNRLTALEPPPELRLRKSVLARTLGLRAPYETCRIAARENALVRYAPPIEHSGRVATRLGALALLLIAMTGFAVAGRGEFDQLLLAAGLMTAVAAGLGAIVLNGRFPEPAYVQGTRSGPWAAGAGGLVAGLTALAVLGSIAAPATPTGPGALVGVDLIRDLHRALLLTPAALAVALLTAYTAGVLATRHATARDRSGRSGPGGPAVPWAGAGVPSGRSDPPAVVPGSSWANSSGSPTSAPAPSWAGTSGPSSSGPTSSWAGASGSSSSAPAPSWAGASGAPGSAAAASPLPPSRDGTSTTSGRPTPSRAEPVAGPRPQVPLPIEIRRTPDPIAARGPAPTGPGRPPTTAPLPTSGRPAATASPADAAPAPRSGFWRRRRR